RHCGLRIYLDYTLPPPRWRHHSSNFVECFGGLTSLAEAAGAAPTPKLTELKCHCGARIGLDEPMTIRIWCGANLSHDVYCRSVEDLYNFFSRFAPAPTPKAAPKHEEEFSEDSHGLKRLKSEAFTYPPDECRCSCNPSCDCVCHRKATPEAAPEQFTEQERMVIGDLAKRQEISEHKVLVQALRLYQLHILGVPQLGDKA